MSEPKDSKNTETKKNKKFNIVVVDDTELSRSSVSKLLENAGYDVLVEAESAEAALKSLQNNQVDLFLIDVVMPEVSGIELAKLVQEQFEHSAIIMMSSLNMEHIIIESISSGAIDFLKKPFSKQELLLAVQRVEQLKQR